MLLDYKYVVKLHIAENSDDSFEFFYKFLPYYMLQKLSTLMTKYRMNSERTLGQWLRFLCPSFWCITFSQYLYISGAAFTSAKTEVSISQLLQLRPPSHIALTKALLIAQLRHQEHARTWLGKILFY